MRFGKKWICSMLALAMLAVGAPLGLRTVAANPAPVSVQQSFIQSIAASAVTIARAHGLFPSVMIAQAILESDWGRSKLASPPYYNLFGIKGGSDGVVFDTLEDDGTGNYYGIRDSFRRYNSYLESLEDYANLFRSTPYLTRVYANFVNATTVEEACQALTGTYATDTRYGSKLMNIIVGYNLLQYDGQVNRGPSWAIKPMDDTVYSQYNQVNIRADHSTASAVLGRAQAGQSFRRLGVTTGWTLIQLADGRKAYIASEYVDVNPPVDDVTGQPIIYKGDKLTPAPKPGEPATQPSESKAKDPLEEIDRILHPEKYRNETTKPGETNEQGETVSSQPAGESSPSAENSDKQASVQSQPAETPPPEPEEPANNPEQPTKEEVAAAKAAADQAIAEGPSSSTKSGLLDSRTAGVKNENPVDKSALEGFLGSDVDLPFTSEEVKEEYRTTLQQAVSLYWNPQAKQEDIDAVVEKLTELREKAEQEDKDGLKQDQEKVRELQAGKPQVRLLYTKQIMDSEDEPVLEAKLSKKLDLPDSVRHTLRARGQRMAEYDLSVKSKEGAIVRFKEPVELHLPLPADFDPAKVELYRLDGDKLTKLSIGTRNHELVLHTKEMGRFIAVERNVLLERVLRERTVYADNPGSIGAVTVLKPESPYGWELLVLLILFALAQCGWFGYKYFKKKTHHN